ncbi:MAG: hypothetical protein DBX66_01775 [Clostridiales bacterium]|uniref:acyl-[acyl-carrier-protein] thioesterase n=1 Tax=Provencibacterium massiliense TaxID=1841868 RepID=UPI0009A8415C|nr:acyl-ACP thioesterase domain-containing protein [Provencibacterium massiliense]PWM39647.1 MAG: hypothetical protein DBX66_01775 [Clostridiales bacterium]RGB68939.1 hypothetical protein DW086_04245 [Harryflintia acetispora]
MPLINDNKQYEKNIQVQSYECDILNRIKLSYLLRHMQEISGEHLDELGLPYERLAELGQVFLLAKLRLKIERLPRCRERLRLLTTPKLPIKAQFIRTNEIFSEAGERLAVADTTWLLVDPQSRRILRPKEFTGVLPMTEDLEPTTLTRYRPLPPEGLEPAGVREVRYSDLDINRHMNNAGYADVICDALPFGELEREAKELYLHYQNEVREGERISLLRGKTSEGSWYLRGEKETLCCFEALLTLE